MAFWGMYSHLETKTQLKAVGLSYQKHGSSYIRIFGHISSSLSTLLYNFVVASYTLSDGGIFFVWGVACLANVCVPWTQRPGATLSVINPARTQTVHLSLSLSLSLSLWLSATHKSLLSLSLSLSPLTLWFWSSQLCTRHLQSMSPSLLGG